LQLREKETTQILQKPVVAVILYCTGKNIFGYRPDSVEINRLKGRKIQWHTGRSIKQSEGLRISIRIIQYFGEVIKGLNVVDSLQPYQLAATYDRPLNDVRIIKMKLVKR